MDMKIIKAAAAVLSMTMLLSGCITTRPVDRLPESTQERTSITVRTKTAPPEETAEPTYAEGYEGDRSRFTDSGTIISTKDGYRIDRLRKSQEHPMGGDKWTVLIYLCGTDLESNYSAAATDLYEMLQGKCGEGVNIIVQTGGTADWSIEDFDEEKTQRYVNRDGYLELLDEQPLQNMGDPDTLSDFITWGAENYPADNMGLIFWNHGGGSISGVCFDERFGYDSLSLPEINSALNASFDSLTERFEFIGFDACLMATLEMANILAPFAKYMYASQETEPGGGWDYTALTSYLAYDNEADGLALGIKLGEAYYKECEFGCTDDNATFSIIDLSQIDPLLEAFNETAKELFESKDFIDLVYCINEADNFGGNSRTEGYSNMVDLGSMMRECKLECRSAKKVIPLLEKAVVYMKNGEVHKDASGLSVYYPLGVQGSVELSVFADICPSTYYLAFVDKVAYVASGNLLTDHIPDLILVEQKDIWHSFYNGGNYSINTDTFATYDSSSSIPVNNVYFTDSGAYTVKLGSSENLKYAACSIFYITEDDGTIYFGSDDDVIYDLDNNLIADNFDGTWICLDDGQPLAIEFVEMTENYSYYTCEVLLNGEFTNLRIEYSWNDHDWRVAGAWKGVDSLTGMAHRDFVQLKTGDVITPVYYYSDDYEDYYFEGDQYVVKGDVYLSYEYLPDGDYAYCMTLYDIFGNWYFTPFAFFSVEDEGLFYYPDSLVFETE